MDTTQDGISLGLNYTLFCHYAGKPAHSVAITDGMKVCEWQSY